MIINVVLVTALVAVAFYVWRNSERRWNEAITQQRESSARALVASSRITIALEDAGMEAPKFGEPMDVWLPKIVDAIEKLTYPERCRRFSEAFAGKPLDPK